MVQVRKWFSLYGREIISRYRPENSSLPLLYARVERFDGSVAYEHSAINPKFVPQDLTGDSWIRIWSMSKTVTIAAILSLEEDGVLSRSDPVFKYIPEFADLKVFSAGSDSTSCEKNSLNLAET